MRRRLKDLVDWARRTRGRVPPTGSTRPGGSLEGHGLADTDIRAVRVEYEPCLDGDPDPGEVVWAWVSYEDDPARGKDRPVVVIGRAGQYLAAVALTTRDGDHHDNLALGTGPWDSRGRPSYAKLDRVLRLDPARVRREGAVLDAARFDRLIQVLRHRAQ